jgi:hypothetical protein
MRTRPVRHSSLSGIRGGHFSLPGHAYHRDLRPSFGEPPPASVADPTCDVVAAEVRLQSVTAVVSRQPLHLPAVGEYRARVHAGGRAAAERLDEGTFGSGVERWLIQLWPV